MTPQEFAGKIRAKFPKGIAADGRAYTDIPDEELSKKIIEKHPVYASQVKFPVPAAPAVGSKERFDAVISQDPVTQAAIGVGKGVASTFQGLGQLVLKGTDALGITKDKSKTTLTADPETLKPQGTAQNVGYYGEKAAEFFAPAGLVRKGQAAVDTLIHGSGLLSGAGRVAAKAAIEGGAAGGVNLAQTADFKEAGKTALFAGGLKVATGAAGEIAKAVNLPERLYSTIFKNSFQDMKQELQTVGTKAFQQTDPARFKDLVSKGIIKVGPDGKAVLDETLAKEALDRGLKGSLMNMSNAVVRNKYELEDQVQAIAKHSREVVSIPEKQFASVLTKIATDYKDVGFGEFSTQAAKLAKVAKTGELSVDDALQARRLLDSLRIRSSFGTAPTHLSLGQDNLKFLSNQLRSRLNSVPGMGDLMKEYSFNIDALEALAKEAARRGNNQVISLIDSILLGGGLAAANPVPNSVLFAAKKLIQNPRTLTAGAQAIKKSGNLTKTGAALKATAASASQSFQQNQ